MLVLSRHKSEAIVIDPRDCPKDENGLITVMVVEIRGDKVRLGVAADKATHVHRQEVWDAIQRQEKAHAVLPPPPAPIAAPVVVPPLGGFMQKAG